VHHSASYVEGVQYAAGSFQEETKSDAGLRLLSFEGLEMSSGGGHNLMFDVSQHTFSAGCLTCTEYGVECTTSRPFRRGGRKLTPQSKGTRGAVRTSIEVEDLPVDRQSKEAPLDDSKFGLQNLIRRLVQIYQDTMYPKYASFLRHNPSSSNTANFLGSFPFLPKKGSPGSMG
jgi:hypothetical protein